VKDHQGIRTGKVPTLVLLFSVVLLSTGLEALSQTRALRLKAFAGTWNANYNGKVIIMLRLDAVGDHPSGTVQLAGFQLALKATAASWP
jgi:hypothetical protein